MGIKKSELYVKTILRLEKGFEEIKTLKKKRRLNA